MRRLRWAWIAATVLASGQAGFAQDPVPATDIVPATGRHFRPATILPPDCPPGTIRPLPVDPTRPVDPKRPIDPKLPDPKDPVAPPPTEPPAPVAPEPGTLAANTFNANMFGDQFGGQTQTLVQTINRIRQFNQTVSGTFSEPSLLSSHPPIPYTGQAGATILRAPFGAVIFLTDNGGTRQFASPDFQSTVPLSGNRQAPYFVPVRENATFRAQLQSLNPGSALIYNQAGSTASLQGNIDSFGDFFVQQAYQVVTPQVFTVLVPTPGDGGVVGRTKLAEDNNPIPRDRIILNADWYSNTVLAPGGFDVTRVSPGFEMTFFDRMASLEVRAPFASTLDSIIGAGGVSGRATEFGNVNVTLKALGYAGQSFAVSGGLGISLPTASDIVVRGADGADVMRIKNEAVGLTPFLAALWTPTDRAFIQGWTQVSVDPMGNPVVANGLGIGRLHNQSLFATDVQVGYWVIQNGPGSFLRGFAPFAELHYNSAISDTDSVRAGNITFASANNRFDELNLTLGATAIMADNLLLSAGLVVPLRGGDNRFFDYQFGVRANWFFGPTAQARAMGDAAGSGLLNAPSMLGKAETLSGGEVVQASGFRPRTDCPTPSSPGVPTVPPTTMPPSKDGPIPPAVPDGPAPVAPEPGTLAANTFNPNFFGDLIGLNQRGRPLVTNIAGTQARRAVQLPVLPRYNGLKISDNDGPRPQDRIFFSYNRYSDVNGSVNPADIPEIHLSRMIVGAETTFGSDLSLAARLPFLRSGGSPEFEANDVGDLTVIGKYAFINDPGTGNVVTIGLNLTLPTGGRGEGLGVLNDGTRAPRTAFIQPWLGAAWNAGDMFVQGTSAVVLPADPVYPTVAFNSVGLGYWLYRNPSDSLIQAITPVIEAHVNTPLTNRGDDAPIFLRDQVNITTGVYLQFPNLTVGGALCVPIVGPRPYDLEAMVSVSYRY